MEIDKETAICGLGALMTMVTTTLGYFVHRNDRAIESCDQELDSLKDGHKDCKIDLANFKTEVAREYARDNTVQQSLARIHERMDEGFDELRADVKTILAKVK